MPRPLWASLGEGGGWEPGLRAGGWPAVPPSTKEGETGGSLQSRVNRPSISENNNRIIFL